MWWKTDLHGHGKPCRGAMADKGTQTTPSPSSSQAHHSRARSPAAKPSCWGYPHCTYVYTYFPLTDLLPHQPAKGTGWWHWWFCVCASAECVCLCLSVWCMYCIRVHMCLCAYSEYTLSLTTGWTQDMELRQPHLCQATRFSISLMCCISIYLFPAKTN